MWTLNYNHSITRRENDIPSIVISDRFYMLSTNTSNLNNCQRNFHHQQMDFCMLGEIPILPSQLPTILPFQNINSIVCHLAYPQPVPVLFLENALIRLKRSKFA